jgi:hypothetical protein
MSAFGGKADIPSTDLDVTQTGPRQSVRTPKSFNLSLGEQASNLPLEA